MARPKGGLGRGLGALIPGPEETGAGLSQAGGGPVEIPIEAIEPNPWQPRQLITEESLRELADSILEHGVIQPLVLSRVTEESELGPAKYRLIAGERRWQAARMAGLTTVPAIVKDASPQEMLELALVENLQRADLNPLEEAMAYRQLMTEFGLTQEQVAERVGKSRTAVANAVRLLRLPEQIKGKLASGEISEGHARALLQLEDTTAQLEALSIVLEKGLNVRQTEDLVRQTGQSSAPKPPQHRPVPITPEERALEEDFRRALGTKVHLVRSKGGGGRLVVQFFSQEELYAIYEIIMRGRQNR